MLLLVRAAGLTVVGLGLRGRAARGAARLALDGAALLDERAQALDLRLVLAQLGVLRVFIADRLVLYGCNTNYTILRTFVPSS